MTRFLLLLVFLLICAVGLAQEIDKTAIADAEVSRFIDDWTKTLPPKWRRRAYSHKASVVQWSLEYKLDPLLVSRIISCESSWRDWVTGKLGEIGLMQIHNSEMERKYDVKNDPDQNIRAGCELLRNCLDKCGTLKTAIGCYGTGGYCTNKGSWLEYRWKLYQQDVKKFRINPPEVKENLPKNSPPRYFLPTQK